MPPEEPARAPEELHVHVEPQASHETEPPVPIAYVLSLGSLCCTARFMQDHGLRPFAGPFDWIFSSPSMVSHCLRDDFKLFLEPEQYHSVDMSDCTAGHALYSEMIGKKTVFNHHNPLTPHDYEHFIRAVTRFKVVLTSPLPKLLLLVTKTPPPREEVADLFSTLLDRPGTQNFELLVVDLRTCPGGSAPTSNLVVHQRSAEQNAALHFYEMRCRAAHSGVVFLDALDAAHFDELCLHCTVGDAGVGALVKRRFALEPDPLPPRPGEMKEHPDRRRNGARDTGRRLLRTPVLTKLAKRLQCSQLRIAVDDEQVLPTAQLFRSEDQVALWLPTTDSNEAVEQLLGHVLEQRVMRGDSYRAAVLVPDSEKLGEILDIACADRDDHAEIVLHLLTTFQKKADLFRYQYASVGSDADAQLSVLRRGAKNKCRYVVLGIGWVPT